MRTNVEEPRETWHDKETSNVIPERKQYKNEMDTKGKEEYRRLTKKKLTAVEIIKKDKLRTTVEK